LIYALPTAFLATIVLIVALRPVAKSIDLLDTPSSRKQHVGAIPLVGGLAVYSAVLVTALLFPFWKTHEGLKLMLLGLPILIVGIVDDHNSVSVRGRLLVEILCCLVVADYFGIRLETLGELFPGMEARLHWFALPVTIFGMVGVMNAYNMVDGVDGLSGGLGIMTFSALALLTLNADAATGWQVFTVAAALLGFLVFNFRFPGRKRASVFMGDAGTMVVGFILAIYIIRLSQGPEAVITPVAALWLFAVPLMDTVAVMLRRIFRGHSPFKPDCEHLHHIFMQSGSDVNATVLKIYGLQAAGIAFACAGLFLDIPQWISFWLFMAVFAIYYVVMAQACKATYSIRNLRR
jgi:UDP-GlcNAc:undecaprenyl-phosphate GlcNAc-1-phosphate transferase